jgi:hypothetical protein
MQERRLISQKMRAELLGQSRYTCAICGSKAYLELAYIRPLSLGGDATPDNIIVLCPTCHRSVDLTNRISAQQLMQIKAEWISNGRLGRETILRDFAFDVSEISRGFGWALGTAHELGHWLIALSEYTTFDSVTGRIMNELSALQSEDDFINSYLRPVLEWLGFLGITVLHHTGRPEHGKDIVFHDDDKLGGLSFYAVVATRDKIHANSAKTSSSGHYAKILDQVKKCYMLPHKDMNLKSSFFIDKVIVASAADITEEALLYFREWEDKERRHLIYWSGPTIAGMILKLQVGGSAGQVRAAKVERELLEVQDRIKVRAFTEVELDRIREGLVPIEDKVPVEIVTPEPRYPETDKAELMGQQLAKAFREAGWTVSESKGKVPQQGLRGTGCAPVKPPSNPLVPALDAVQAALYKAGVNTQCFCEFDPDKYPHTSLKFAIGINPMVPSQR